MLKSINLSLSSICGADCLFCPPNRGTSVKQKIMPFSLVKKIVDEVAAKDFSEKHRVERFIIGENGDSFINKDIIEILRYIKFKLPEITIQLITNFQNFSKDKAEIILNEKLVDNFFCNIDGGNGRNYFLVKRIDLETVKKNLIDFLEIRRKLKNESSLIIYVITLSRYIKTIHSNFGFYPSKLKDLKYLKVPDDFASIKNQWEKVLDLKKDKIFRLSIFGWSERDKINCRDINYQKYSCPMLHRMQEEAFIASDGIWYACCYDSNNELILGDVTIDSIDKIYSGQIRKNLIEMLEKKEFDKISGPCRTVNCCQALFFEPQLKKILRRFISPHLAFRIRKLCSKSTYLKSLLDKFN